MLKVNISEKLAQIHEFWSPHIAGEVNDTHVKLAKLKGEFDWHFHENEDEMFLVIKGNLTIQLRNENDVILQEGEFFIVPKGLEHRPVAKEEVHIMLIEPKTTLNTGNVLNERTKQNLKQI